MEINMASYENQGFNENQLDIIKDGLKAGIDVSIFAKPEFNWQQMYQLCRGLKEDIDVSSFANPDLTSQEMYVARIKTIAKLYNEKESVLRDDDYKYKELLELYDAKNQLMSSIIEKSTETTSALLGGERDVPDNFKWGEYVADEKSALRDKIIIPLDDGSHFTVLCKHIVNDNLKQFLEERIDNVPSFDDKTRDCSILEVGQYYEQIQEIKYRIADKIQYCSEEHIAEYVNDILAQKNTSYSSEKGEYAALSDIDAMMIKGLQGYFSVSDQGVSMPSDATVLDLIKDYEKNGLEIKDNMVFACNMVSNLYYELRTEEDVMREYGCTLDEAFDLLDNTEERDYNGHPMISGQYDPWTAYYIVGSNGTEGFIPETELTREQCEIVGIEYVGPVETVYVTYPSFDEIDALDGTANETPNKDVKKKDDPII